MKNLPRSRSGSRAKGKSGCLRCGRVSHLASSCQIYREFCDTHCKKCNLLHKTAVCRETEAQVHLGELDMEEDVPVRGDVRDKIEEVDLGEEIYFDQPIMCLS